MKTDMIEITGDIRPAKWLTELKRDELWRRILGAVALTAGLGAYALGWWVLAETLFQFWAR